MTTRSNSPTPERRSYAVPLAVRAAEGEPARRQITGHAAVFNQLSEDLGGFREKIAPGAFSKSIGGDVRALWNHNSDLVIGRSVSKTLTLRETPAGLETVITPPDTETARHWLALIERGDVSQMSFGFRTVADKWERDRENNVTRTLIEVELFDVSPVTFPAYPQTDVATRAFDGFKDAERRALGTPIRDRCARDLALLEVSSN